MLFLYSGPPGSGKSLLATYDGITALKEHRNVIANFPFDMKYFRKRKVGNFTYIPTHEITPEFLLRYAIKNHKRRGKWKKRCQTVVILDEAEMIFNTRGWKNDNRTGWINFLSNHRHFNYDIILACPTDKMIDKQIRGLITTEYKCRSIGGFGFIGDIIQLLIGKTFVAVQYNCAAHTKVFPPRFYKLHKRKANVYDTMRMFEGMIGYQEMMESDENAKDDSDKGNRKKNSVIADLLCIGIRERIQAACKG